MAALALPTNSSACLSKFSADGRRGASIFACVAPSTHGAALFPSASLSARFGERVFHKPLIRETKNDFGDDAGLNSRRSSRRRVARASESAIGVVTPPVAKDDGFLRSKLAVFVSGGGSNFRALHESSLKNSIYGDITVVVSDKPSCKGCEYARQHDFPVLIFPLSKHAQDGLSTPDLVAALRKYGIDFVLLAGYLKLLPPELVRAYPRSILNMHPALLPAFGGRGFYGMKVHEAVIKSGARFTGATVHFVDEHFDTGPILAQRVVPVVNGDSPEDLAKRVLKEEHGLYSEAVAALCEDRIFWRRDGVPLIRRSWDEAEYY